MSWNRACLKAFKNGGGATPANFAFPSASLSYPDGWFCLGFSHELDKEKSTTRRLMGEDVVLIRGGSGKVRAIRPYCPHLGAHLGVMGDVSGEEITCRFHNFVFDLDGPCRRTPYGQPPTQANLDTLPARETGGLILVWRSQNGSSPSWEPPDISTTGWQVPRWRAFEIATHIQQIAENTIDFGHVSQLHGIPSSLLSPPEVSFDSEILTVDYHFQRNIFGERGFRVEFHSRMYGLGLNVMDVVVPKTSTRFRMFGLPTPAGPWLTHFRLAITVAVNPIKGVPDRLAKTVNSVVARAMRDLFFMFILNETHPDLPVWHYQKYQQVPRLTRGDGPIGKYRKWAEQFYSMQ
ncbi:MAG: Rieske 2Fe-2S domain-containing protein [Pseudonocardiaceae bacterium]